MPSRTSYDADMHRNKALKQVLADNVSAVMRARQLKQQHVAALARQKGYVIDQTTVGRIARAAIPTTVDKLHAIAAAFGLEPWLLLVQDLDHDSLPNLGDAALLVDEREMLESYRAAGPRWKVALRYMAKLHANDDQEELAEGVNVLLAKIAAQPVADQRVEEALGKVPSAEVVHQPPPPPYKPGPHAFNSDGAGKNSTIRTRGKKRSMS